MALDEETDRSTASGLDDRFRIALDSILDLVVLERAIRDAAGSIVDFEIVWMNNAPIDVAGRPREELIGRRISELYPVLAGGELIDGYRRVVETGEPLIVDVLPYEDVIDGKPVAGFFTVQASKYEDGVLVASRDITPLESSRRQLEVALRELEAAHRLAKLGTWRVDFTNGTATVSRELRRIYGLQPRDPDDLAIDELARHIHVDDRQAVNDAYERALQGKASVVVEHRVINADGTLRYVRSYAQPIIEGNAVVGMWGTTQDVTDRVMSRNAYDLEHTRRVTAEAVAELASVLSGVATRQALADAVFETVQSFGSVSVVALALTEAQEPIVREYFGGGGLPGEIEARYLRTPLAVDTPLTRCVTRARPVVMPDVQAQLREFPALAGDFQTVGFKTLAVLPLHRAVGDVFGALAVGWPEEDRYDPDIARVLDEVVAITARTVERLELLDLERSVAQTLQVALLALDTRTTEAIVRARYQPADIALEIGGDWYDTVDLEDGRLAVAVGDVVGRGLAAAATMGQLRAALGITALQAADAAQAIGMLDRYARHVPGAQCATVAFAVVDARRQTVSYATAGHVPPLLVTPDGAAVFLEGGRSWPLGIDGDKPRPPAAMAEVPAGSLLVFYTDGLIERRGEPLDAGLQRLRDVVARNWRLPLRRLKNAVFSELVDGAASDDIALVALRTVGSGTTYFADAFRARHDELAGSRRRLREWLEKNDLVSLALDDVLVAVGEAIANAIDHGSDDESHVVRIEAVIVEQEVVVSISDSGHWQPGIEGFFAGRGRGHLLMESFASKVDVDTDQHGTIVTLQFKAMT